jgi:uncharacterized protein YodC (DUF2158 family)
MNFKVGDVVKYKSGGRPDDVATIAEIVAGGLYAMLAWKDAHLGTGGGTVAPLHSLELVSDGSEPRQ